MTSAAGGHRWFTPLSSSTRRRGARAPSEDTDRRDAALYECHTLSVHDGRCVVTRGHVIPCAPTERPMGRQPRCCRSRGQWEVVPPNPRWAAARASRKAHWSRRWVGVTSVHAGVQGYQYYGSEEYSRTSTVPRRFAEALVCPRASLRATCCTSHHVLHPPRNGGWGLESCCIVTIQRPARNPACVGDAPP